MKNPEVAESVQLIEVDGFVDIHDLYYPVVYSTVYTKVGNRDDAEDICQDIFYSLMMKFHEVQNPRKWLNGALRLAVLEYYRKSNYSDTVVDEMFPDVSLTFVNGMRDTRIIINDIITQGKLFDTDLDAVIFDLVAIKNYSYSEAAEELSVTKRIVEYRYRKIADKIIAELRKMGIKYLEDIL